MNGEKEFFADEYQMEIGRNDVIFDGKDGVIYTTGSILEEVAQARCRLADSGKEYKVVNVVTIKPFDVDSLKRDALSYKTIFVVEEHNIHGGLGSIIAEVIAFGGLGARVVPVGLKDRFAQGYGTHARVRRINGLDAEAICEVIRSTVGE